MLRVSASRARAGMVLARNVYDIRGQQVLPRHMRLDDENLLLLARAGSSQILIEDARMADVPVSPLFPDDLEAKAVCALHVLLVLKEGVTDVITETDLRDIRSAVFQMVELLFPVALGDPDLSSSCTPQGYDYLHPIKVAELSLVLGREAGLDAQALMDLGLAATLQNIGYLCFPRGLLDESGPVRDTEGHLKKHPGYSTSLLGGCHLSPSAIEAIAQHHERWDGSGYPDRLAGSAISLAARIIAIADTFHSLLSKRPHRTELQPHEAVEFIANHGGDLFDPELVRIFVRRIPQYPAGLGVRLNTGHSGIVSNPNAGQIGRPVVRICVEKGAAVPRPYDIDLSDPDHADKAIVQVLL